MNGKSAEFDFLKGMPPVPRQPRRRPACAIVTTQDHTIAPALQKSMVARSGAKATEIASSLMVYISHPQELARVIMDAVKAVD